MTHIADGLDAGLAAAPDEQTRELVEAVDRSSRTPTPCGGCGCAPTPTPPRTRTTRGSRRGGHRAVPDGAHAPRGSGGCSWSDSSSPTTMPNARPPWRRCSHRSARTSWRSCERWTNYRRPSGSSTHRCTSCYPTSPSCPWRSRWPRSAARATSGENGCWERWRWMHEANPVPGLRGVRLGVVVPGLFALQVRAIAQVTAQLRAEGLDPRPESMVPLAGSVRELQLVRQEAEQILAEEGRVADVLLDLPIGVMFELPGPRSRPPVRRAGRLLGALARRRRGRILLPLPGQRRPADLPVRDHRRRWPARARRRRGRPADQAGHAHRCVR